MKSAAKNAISPQWPGEESSGVEGEKEEQRGRAVFGEEKVGADETEGESSGER